MQHAFQDMKSREVKQQPQIILRLKDGQNSSPDSNFNATVSQSLQPKTVLLASEITILRIFFSSVGPFFHTDSSTTLYTLISLSSNTHIISYFSIYILPSLNALCREQSDYKFTTIKTSIAVFAATSYTSLTESIDLNAKRRAHYHPFQNDFSSSWHHQECKLKMLFYFCFP